jgi:hypothetical protein
VKLVIAIVRPEKANDVLEALYRGAGQLGWQALAAIAAPVMPSRRPSCSSRRSAW